MRIPPLVTYASINIIVVLLMLIAMNAYAVEDSEFLNDTFSRDLYRTATTTSKRQATTTDPLHKLVNLTMWGQAIDPILESFKRDLEHMASSNYASPSLSKDGLAVY